MYLSFFSWIKFFAATSAQERESISGVLNVVRTHANTLETLREDHDGQAASIEHRASETFQQQFRVCNSVSIFVFRSYKSHCQHYLTFDTMCEGCCLF